jgi:hypothetical protein
VNKHENTSLAVDAPRDVRVERVAAMKPEGEKRNAEKLNQAGKKKYIVINNER